ncbi:quinoprotein relay system zinc metallohydrolase 2 [Mesorhizobium sp. J18]|nr:quinoprotein relay system zinc metallohydrolase 2 [Mesorhizobium sp. J18]
MSANLTDRPSSHHKPRFSGRRIADAGFSRSPAMSRRDVLLGGFCLCCIPQLGFAAAETTGLEEIASGVFVRRGPDVEASPGNRNGIANIGFIVGRDAVLVTDPGGSLADGRWLRSEIRKHTEKPIRHVVVTHMHPDHCFGAAAFEEDRPNIIGHHGLGAALQARGEFYRQRLAEILGPQEVGAVVLPTQEVSPDGAEVDLGGRVIRLKAHEAAHTTCDLSMTDSETGLLFAGDLLFVGRVPSLDGSLLGWLDELQKLRALDAKKIVPGHGPAAAEAAPAIADLERYLATLRDETREAIDNGMTIDEAVETVAQSERDRWTLFDDYNGRNVTQAYKELEWE